MEEAKRIVRYTLPGLVYVILLIISFLILYPNLIKGIIGIKVPEINKLQAEGTISFPEIITAFIITGGIGYLFSIIYFAFFWIFSLFGYHIYNHKSVVNKLVKKGKLKIIRPEIPYIFEESITLLSRRQAWRIVNVFWHGRKKVSQTIEGLSEKLEPYYSDITTGLGTTLVASVFSLITFYIINNTFFKFTFQEAQWCYSIYFLTIFLVAINYVMTFKSYEKMVNIAFATEVYKEYKEKDNSPVIIVFYK